MYFLMENLFLIENDFQNMNSNYNNRNIIMLIKSNNIVNI